jgi:hypothetical protein
VKVHFDRFDYRSCLIRLPIYENVRSERYESAPFDIYKRYLIASQQLTAKPPFRPIPDGRPGIRAENSQISEKKKKNPPDPFPFGDDISPEPTSCHYTMTSSSLFLSSLGDISLSWLLPRPASGRSN